MSKLKVQNPVVHTPSLKEDVLSSIAFRPKLEAIGLKIPLFLLDGWYYYVSLEDWGKVLWDLVFSSSLTKLDKFDCDNYALKAMTICHERYGLNTMGMVIGNIPSGRHAFNIFYHGDGFKLWEPNSGFTYAGTPFEIGENGYHMEIVLI